MSHTCVIVELTTQTSQAGMYYFGQALPPLHMAKLHLGKPVSLPHLCLSGARSLNISILRQQQDAAGVL
jgi:hypothetical protein